MGSQGRGDAWQGGGWQWLAEPAVHICVQIHWEEQLGRETDHTTQGSSAEK